MGNAPGYVLIAVVVLVVGWIVVRARRRAERQAPARVLADVLSGSIDERGHAVGTYGPHKLEAYLSYADATPSEHSTGGDSHPVHQLHVVLRSTTGSGGGVWVCGRSPSPRAGHAGSIEFAGSPFGAVPRVEHLLGRFGVEQIGADVQQRLVEAGLFDAIDALGRGASGWLPSVYRAPRPFGASPFPVSAPSTGGKGGVKYTCVLEVGGPELRVEEFRALLDAILRVVAVDAAVNT